MNKFLSIVPRWIPSILLMVVIFIFSSRSANELPNFLSWDYIVKKGGHVIGYGLLAFTFYFAFYFDPRYRTLTWLLTILYAATDEFHQSFVAGRHSTLFDVLIFDNIGAFIALWLASKFIKAHG